MPKKKDDPWRGTGRTTGLILTAIGNALLNPGKVVLFVDHAMMTRDHSRKMQESVEEIIASLGLRLRVRRRVKNSLGILSLVPPKIPDWMAR
jgi:hypothetical protein